ncbi:hypothetical protein [Mucilaginibacter terrae]|uniref:Uncharacterized protein n=1 Tax=Mucilaginibacter terrae TaxID=1955052 RepID=A0ABU3GW45_9SPHI|nr:hypothetical protein [Mucilaginibacter terrae]MDT3403993.1 hypothetical protein [Mucilaginibacter terrae]
MPTHDFEEVNVNRWWWLKRLEYNKGLLVSGAIAFVIGGFSSVMLYPNVVHFLFIPFGIACTLYFIAANIAFTLGWVLDIAFNSNNEDNFRLMIYKCGYWLSVLVPPLLTLSIILFFVIAHPNHYLC